MSGERFLLKLKILSIPMLALVVVASIAGFFVMEVGAQFAEVKFRGTATTDEEWGELTCYGELGYVTVDEILHDPNGTLMLGLNVSVCYSMPLSLRSGDQVECYGYYCTGSCPLQLIGHVVCIESPYYVVLAHTPSISISPLQPSASDRANVSVTFHFTTYPPFVESFGSLVQSGNTFSIDVIVFLPEPSDIVTMIVHDIFITQDLGMLPQGTYEFQVYVNYTYWMKGTYYLAETASFNVESALPVLSVSPSEVVVFVGQEFSLNVMIHDVSVDLEMVAWQFRIYQPFGFDEHLAMLSATEGPFMKQSPTPPYTCSDCTLFVFHDTREDNGPFTPFYLLACMLIPDPGTGDFPYFSEGSGILVTFGLRATAAGNCTFELSHSQLSSPNGEWGISHIAIDGHIEVREPILGDVNLDSKVDMEDIALGALSFGSHQESPRWNPQVDVDKNGKVDLKDIALIARNFGETYP